jgi:hypothetical protein
MARQQRFQLMGDGRDDGTVHIAGKTEAMDVAGWHIQHARAAHGEQPLVEADVGDAAADVQNLHEQFVPVRLDLPIVQAAALWNRLAMQVVVKRVMAVFAVQGIGGDSGVHGSGGYPEDVRIIHVNVDKIYSPGRHLPVRFCAYT